MTEIQFLSLMGALFYLIGAIYYDKNFFQCLVFSSGAIAFFILSICSKIWG